MFPNSDSFTALKSMESCETLIAHGWQSVVVSSIFFFSPILGEMIQFDEHIFEMGWFNHQLVVICNILMFDVHIQNRIVVPTKSTNKQKQERPKPFPKGDAVICCLKFSQVNVCVCVFNSA